MSQWTWFDSILVLTMIPLGIATLAILFVLLHIEKRTP